MVQSNDGFAALKRPDCYKAIPSKIQTCMADVFLTKKEINKQAPITQRGGKKRELHFTSSISLKQ